MTDVSNAISTTGGQTDDSISAIDQAMAAQAKRKAEREAAASKNGGGESVLTSTTAEKKGRTVLTSEERLARAQQIEKDRKDRAEKRAADSKIKREEALAARGTPHMSKVNKAAAGLASLTATAEALFNDIKKRLSKAEIDVLTAHLSFHSRSEATRSALDVKLEAGAKVRIISGPAKLIGLEGVLERVQRIHCYVTIPGHNRPAYLFNSDVEAIDDADTSEPEQVLGLCGIHDDDNGPTDAEASTASESEETETEDEGADQVS